MHRVDFLLQHSFLVLLEQHLVIPNLQSVQGRRLVLLKLLVLFLQFSVFNVVRDGVILLLQLMLELLELDLILPE